MLLTSVEKVVAALQQQIDAYRNLSISLAIAQ
jgi:hypothetical protein